MYAGDYLSDTLLLNLEEHGAYMKLLLISWNNGAPLPDDDKLLSKYLGITPKRWAKLRPTLNMFFISEKGQFFSKRLEKEREKIEEKIEKNRVSGAMGGRPKALKTNETVKGNGSSSLSENKAILNLEPEPEPDSKEVCNVPSQSMNTHPNLKTLGDITQNVQAAIQKNRPTDHGVQGSRREPAPGEMAGGVERYARYRRTYRQGSEPSTSSTDQHSSAPTVDLTRVGTPHVSLEPKTGQLQIGLQSLPQELKRAGLAANGGQGVDGGTGDVIKSLPGSPQRLDG
jgi:uncharacterized protein YdaU (DUF1376 family)